MNNIIVSLTVLPSRVNSAIKCINSLLNQSTKPDKIYIWHPQNCRRDKTVISKLPDFYYHPLIENLKTEDIGPLTKLLPTVKKEWNNKECKIITADDDVIYPNNWITNLVKASEKSPNCVFCYRGRNFKNEVLKYSNTYLILGQKVSKNIQIDIITGTWGALYKPKFFTEEFFNIDLKSKFFFVDDIWISGNLKKHNVKAYVTHIDRAITPDANNTVTSLWEINRVSDNNDYGINYFKDYFKK